MTVVQSLQAAALTGNRHVKSTARTPRVCDIKLVSETKPNAVSVRLTHKAAHVSFAVATLAQTALALYGQNILPII